MDDREAVFEKIRKCMALTKSSNAHEAAAALRQATKLMEMYKISHEEMLAVGVTEVSVKAGVTSKPSRWENTLAQKIASIFGCSLIFRQQLWSADWVFVGIPPANDVAIYSFEVLFRQAKKARKEFMDENLKRLKKANKVRRADLFSEGWVRAACMNVSPLTSIDGAEEAISAYMGLKFQNLESLDPVDRNKGRQLSHKDEQAIGAGYSAGRAAQLNKGVGAGSSPLMLEGS